jgi:hypothetical protein
MNRRILLKGLGAGLGLCALDHIVSSQLANNEPRAGDELEAVLRLMLDRKDVFPAVSMNKGVRYWADVVREAGERAQVPLLKDSAYRNIVLTIMYQETGFRDGFLDAIGDSDGPMQAQMPKGAGSRVQDVALDVGNRFIPAMLRSTNRKQTIEELTYSLAKLDEIVQMYRKHGRMEHVAQFVFADWNGGKGTCIAAGLQEYLRTHKDVNLNADGVFGPQTRNTLYEHLAQEQRIGPITPKQSNVPVASGFSQTVNLWLRRRNDLEVTTSTLDYSQKAMDTFEVLQRYTAGSTEIERPLPSTAPSKQRTTPLYDFSKARVSRDGRTVFRHYVTRNETPGSIARDFNAFDSAHRYSAVTAEDITNKYGFPVGSLIAPGQRVYVKAAIRRK